MTILDFKDWIVLKNIVLEDFDSPEDPTDKFKFNKNDGEIGNDYESTQREVTKAIMSKYHRQFMRFLNDLAEENSDSELKGFARKLETDKSPGSARSWKPDHHSDQEEIVPPASDRGVDPNSQE